MGEHAGADRTMIVKRARDSDQEVAIIGSDAGAMAIGIDFDQRGKAAHSPGALDAINQQGEVCTALSQCLRAGEFVRSEPDRVKNIGIPGVEKLFCLLER